MADYERKMNSVLDQTKLAVSEHLRIAAELLEKRLSAAPAGATLGDLLETNVRTNTPGGAPEAATKTPEHYLPKDTYELLLQAILQPIPSLCARSQLIETLGDIGGVWPASVDPRQIAGSAA